MATAPTIEPNCTTAPHHTRALWPSSLKMIPMMTFTYDKDRTKRIQVSTCNKGVDSNQYKDYFKEILMCFVALQPIHAGWLQTTHL